MRKIIKDVEKCWELYTQFTDVLCPDDKRELDDYSDEEIIAEAIYTRDKFTDPMGGWIHYDEYIGEEGKECQNEARKTVRQLNALIKKYKNN